MRVGGGVTRRMDAGSARVQLHVLWCQGGLPMWTEMSIYIGGEGTLGEGDELLPKCSTVKRKTMTKP